MSLDQKGRSTSPVHIHVDEEIPVHVHVKKPKKPSSIGIDSVQSEAKIRTSKLNDASNLRRSRASVKVRNGSPPSTSPERWVPPPAKTSTTIKAGKFAWQGPSHRLEISDAGRSPSPLRRDDLSTDDEEKVRGKMRKYEKKIDSLMNEMGELKTEVELQKTKRAMEKKEEMLQSSQLLLEEQDRQLRDFQLELEATEIENRRLKYKAESLGNESDLNRSQRDKLLVEQDNLMKKLIEVEMNGQSAARQVAALKDTIRRLREEYKMAAADSTMLAKQKDLVMDRLNEFEDVNRELRSLLHQRHEEEAANLRLMEQRDLLLKKLSEADINGQQLTQKLFEKDRLLDELRMQINTQREENVGMASLQTSLESTRAHLQKQLRQKDADCNRLAVQIRTLESELAQERIEVEHLNGLLMTARQKAERDKEALKKATRVQKDRALKSEDAVEQLRAQLMERDALLAEMRNELENTRSVCDKISKEKSQAIGEVTDLRQRVAELENSMDRQEADNRNKMDVTMAKLHDKTTETTSLRMDNERLKMSVAAIEEKLDQAEREVDKLKMNIKQYEGLVEEYRSQVNRSRRELDESYVQLEEQKLQTSRISQEGELELEKVKVHLQARLDELEPLPELLKMTELKLQQAQEQLTMFERKNGENMRTIGEQQAKLSHQVDQLEQLRSRLQVSDDEKIHLNTKLDIADRKMQDTDDKNRELLAALAKREEALHQANMRLEEKNRDNAALSRQLEAAIADTHRQVEQTKERFASKERVLQSRILDLESQLSQTRAEVARAKRDKDEAERKFNSKLYDLKDRLEQSASTNRSMQSYVQFLKSSYANVFGDGYTATSPTRTMFH